MSEKIKDMFCQVGPERALLGFCFKSLDNFYAIAASIGSDDFLRTDNKLIYMLMHALEKRGVAHFDSAVIINEAEKNAILEEIGGYRYIYALEDFSTDGANLQFYIDKVLDSKAKYQLYKALVNRVGVVETNAVADDVTAPELIDASEGAILEVSLEAKAVRKATNLSDGLEEYIEQRQNNPVNICGINTGFPIFDSRIDGLTSGSLTVVAARPKQGKSTLLSTIAAHVAFEGAGSVLYIDTEMSFEEFRDRIIAMLSGVPERVVKHGGYTSQQRCNIDQAVRIIQKGKLFHEYCPGYSIDKLRALYKKYKHREDIALGVFDYIKSPEGVDYRNKKEYQILGDVTTALKDMAGMLRIPMLAAVQVNRQQDVADSDRILRYVDVLTFLKPKTPDEIVEEGGLNSGTYRWVITDSRRGGTTPLEGIGLTFIKKSLQIFESKQQFIDFSGINDKEKEEADYSGVSKQHVSEESGDEEESYFLE